MINVICSFGGFDDSTVGYGSSKSCPIKRIILLPPAVSLLNSKLSLKFPLSFFKEENHY